MEKYLFHLDLDVQHLNSHKRERNPSADPSRPDTGPLTPREFEVAKLIAEELSNRAIVDLLVISPRTVDGHVERILAKLEFSSRTQVASWATVHTASA